MYSATITTYLDLIVCLVAGSMVLRLVFLDHSRRSGLLVQVTMALFGLALLAKAWERFQWSDPATGVDLARDSIVLLLIIVRTIRGPI